MDNQFAWVDFYKEFAEKLLAYKNNRKELVKKVKAVYAETLMGQMINRTAINTVLPLSKSWQTLG